MLEGVGERRQHGIALPSLDCIVGELFLVPAGSYFRKSTLQSRGVTSFTDDDWGLPDIVMEMAGREAYGYTMPEKCRRYLEIGIPVAMLVDVDDESIEIMHPGQPPVTVRGDQQIDLSAVVPGFDLTAARLFRDAVPDWVWSRQAQADVAAAPERSEG
jgi:Uma2 family endonuclease